MLRSTKGRIRARLTRLKNPRYLIGAIVGLFYFVFIFRRSLTGGRASVNPDMADGVLVFVGAAIIMMLVAVQWLMVFRTGGLNLTESEMDMLFPAPVSRRALVHYHIIKPFFGFVIAAIFVVFLLQPVLAAGGFIRASILAFFVMYALYAHQTVLDLLPLLPLRAWVTRFAQFLFGIVIILLALIMLATQLEQRTDFILGISPTLPTFAAIVSAPFCWVAAGFSLQSPYSWPIAVATCGVGFALLYGIIALIDVPLEESTARKWQKRQKRLRRRSIKRKEINADKARTSRPHWISDSGQVWRVILGKSKLGFLRYALKMPLATMLPAFLIIWLITFFATPNEARPIFAFLTLMFSAVVMLIGGRVLHLDFRTELEHIELLKSFPIKGFHMVMAVLGINCLVMGAFHLLMACLFAISALSGSGWDWPYSPLAVSIVAIMVFPVMSLVFLLLENLLLLWLPAWFMEKSGEQRTRGFDVMGRRMFNVIVRFLGFTALMLLPALLSLIVFLWVGDNSGLIIAGTCFSLVLAIELVPIVVVAGMLYDRIESLGDEAL